jgi:hypothetical protein
MRLDVALADEPRSVARRAERAYEGVLVGSESDAVDSGTVARRVSTGDDRRSTGHADRVRDVGAVEHQAPSGEAIKVRCGVDGGPAEADHGCRQLVCHDDDNVRRGAHVVKEPFVSGS